MHTRRACCHLQLRAAAARLCGRFSSCCSAPRIMWTRQSSQSGNPVAVYSRAVSPAHTLATGLFVICITSSCNVFKVVYYACEVHGIEILHTVSLQPTPTMVRLQANDRYYSRTGLLNFLQKTFPDCKNFRINEVKDGFFTFEAPRELTDVSGLLMHQARRSH